MTNTWGFKLQPEFNSHCSRCGEHECICGDAAFEAWLEEVNTNSKESLRKPNSAERMQLKAI